MEENKPLMRCELTKRQIEALGQMMSFVNNDCAFWTTNSGRLIVRGLDTGHVMMFEMRFPLQSRKGKLKKEFWVSADLVERLAKAAKNYYSIYLEFIPHGQAAGGFKDDWRMWGYAPGYNTVPKWPSISYSRRYKVELGDWSDRLLGIRKNILPGLVQLRHDEKGLLMTLAEKEYFRDGKLGEDDFILMGNIGQRVKSLKFPKEFGKVMLDSSFFQPLIKILKKIYKDYEGRLTFDLRENYPMRVRYSDEEFELDYIVAPRVWD